MPPSEGGWRGETNQNSRAATCGEKKLPRGVSSNFDNTEVDIITRRERIRQRTVLERGSFSRSRKKIGRDGDGAKWREAEKPLWSFVRQRSNSPTTWQPNRASAAQAATPKVNSIGCNPIINRARVRPAPYFTHRSHTIPSSVRNINSLIGKGRDAKENILCTHLLLFGLVAVDQRVCVRECMSWVEICLVTTANQFSSASFLPI